MDDDWDRVRAAFDRVKGFPEFLPDERARWLELRSAVEKLLERHG
jgi:histidyl-tRNA synthetase